MILHALIWNLLVPACASAIAVAWARRMGRSAPPGRRRRWGVAAGLGLGYAAGHVGILGWPAFPTLDSKEWVAWLAIAAAVLGVVEAGLSLPGWSTWATRGLFVAGSLGLLLRSKVENDWGAAEGMAWLAGLWAALMASWWNLEAQAGRLSGPGWLVPVGVVAVGWSATQALSGAATLGQLDFVLAATLLGALPALGLRPGLALSKGGPAVASTVLAGLGLSGYFYAEVPALSASILAMAPLSPWVDRIGFIRRRSYWTRASVRFLVVVLVVGSAVFVADAGSSPPIEGGPRP